jgi:hypothetical protein
MIRKILLLLVADARDPTFPSSECGAARLCGS